MTLSRAEIQRRWREKHPEEHAARQRAWRKQNPDKHSGYTRNWRAGDPNYPAKTHAANAARLFGEWLPWTVYADIEAMPCFDCGVEPAGGVDHIVPRSRGGRNVVENLQPACIACNKRKGASDE